MKEKKYLKKLDFVMMVAMTFVLCISCSNVIDEPEPVPTPDPDPVVPEVPVEWTWSDMAEKIYGHNGEIANLIHTSEYVAHSNGMGNWAFNSYERFSINQTISIEDATESALTATLNSGWFNSSCLPGCTKLLKIAVPRVIPVANDLKITFTVLEENKLKELGKLGYAAWNVKENSDRMLAHVDDSEGNGVSADIVLSHDSLVYALNYRLKINEPSDNESFLSEFYYDKYYGQSPYDPYAPIQKEYSSINSSKNPDDTKHFISISCRSDEFDNISEGVFSFSEFFNLLTSIKFLKIADYWMTGNGSGYESMDRIMADKHMSQVFYDETLLNAPVGISNLYTNPYKVVLSQNKDECMFFINPDLMFFPAKNNGYHTFYYTLPTEESRNSFFEENLGYEDDNTPSPQYTPKQYDWMVEMLAALSPYTADGLKMKYKLTQYAENSEEKESLVFCFKDENIAKKFVIAYLSVLKDSDHVEKVKNLIANDTEISSVKKEIFNRLLDNLPEILKNGESFNVAFNLSRDKEKEDWQ